MWRSLFLAFGIVLVVSGLECIVVGRFTISQEARLPRFLQDMFDDSVDAGAELIKTGQSNTSVAPAQAMSGYGGIPNTVSRFGPSRFGNSQYGNDQFFGNSATSRAAGNSQFSLSGFNGNSNGGSIGESLSRPSVGPTRIVQTQDWMPWSLIAAGSIIVLYTKRQAAP